MNSSNIILHFCYTKYKKSIKIILIMQSLVLGHINCFLYTKINIKIKYVLKCSLSEYFSIYKLSKYPCPYAQMCLIKC